MFRNPSNEVSSMRFYQLSSDGPNWFCFFLFFSELYWFCFQVLRGEFLCALVLQDGKSRACGSPDWALMELMGIGSEQHLQDLAALFGLALICCCVQ